MAYTLAHLAIAAGGLVLFLLLGRAIGRRSRPLGLSCAALGLVLLLLAYCEPRYRWDRWLPLPGGLWRDVLYAPAAVLPGVALALASEVSRQRVLTLLLGVLYGFFALHDPLYVLLTSGENLDRAKAVIADGVLKQRNDRNCVPASAANVLRAWGVETDDGALALRSQTSYYGTPPHRIIAAIDALGAEKGLRARLVRCTWDDLRAWDRPAILHVKLLTVYEHAIAVVGLSSDRVWIAEPLYGLQDFEPAVCAMWKKWEGEAVIVEPRPGIAIGDPPSLARFAAEHAARAPSGTAAPLAPTGTAAPGKGGDGGPGEGAAAGGSGALPSTPTPAASPDELRLRILSYNVWGIPLITPKWSYRVPRLAAAIAGTGADVVGLQEVWFQDDAERIARESGYPHWRHFDGAGRSGLLVLSRFPIEAPRQTVFGANGFPHYLLFGEADWYAAKSVATMVLRTPLGPLPFANTHLIARHAEGEPRRDRFTTHRATQMVELARALRERRQEMAAAGEPALPLILTGDLNALRSSDETALLLALTGLESVERLAARTDAERAFAESRIDFVLAGRAPGFRLDAERATTSPTATIAGEDGREIPLSDHLGILADVTIRRVPPAEASPFDAAQDLARREDARRAAVDRLGPLVLEDAAVPPALRIAGMLAAVLAIWIPVSHVRARAAAAEGTGAAASRPPSALRRLLGTLVLLAVGAALLLVFLAAFVDAPRTADAVRRGARALVEERCER